MAIRRRNSPQVCFTAPLPRGAVVPHGEHSELPPRPARLRTLSNNCLLEIGGILISVLLRPSKAFRQSALSPAQCERRGPPRLLGCRVQYRQKSHRDRRERHVRTEPSCTAITAEHPLYVLIARQVSPRSTFLDNLPFLIGDVIAAPLLKLPCESGDLLLILLGPS
jgi:hypothetical protein